jgi:hypothetical protein
MATTAKIICNSVVNEQGQYLATFRADYDDDRNKEWARYTPALALSITTALPDVFEPGASYQLTFERE